jgi:YfiR/HmsC-like
MWALAACVLALPGAAARPSSASHQPTEVEVKAAFLYHFAQLVTWPDSPEAAAAPIVIVVLGQDPFGNRLEATIGDATVRGRPLRIERVATPADLSVAPHILFIASTALTDVERALAAVQGSPVLTVGILKGFARQGGMVEFRLTADSRVAFDINVRSVGTAGLKMSSQLLKIARVVEGSR